MNGPLVSVIIPVYNACSYLRRCLDSVMAQTYGQIEIILVNDGSGDSSGDICDEYAGKDGRIRVLHQSNRGLAAARNAGLDIACGHCIGFVDADDWIYPDMYETLVNLLEQTGADVSQCSFVFGDLEPQTANSAAADVCFFQGPEILQAAFREILSWNLWDKLFRADLWKTRRLPEGYYYEDAIVLTDLFSQDCRLVKTSRVEYCYNISSPSITRGEKRKCHLESIEKLCLTWDAYTARQSHDHGSASMLLCKNIPCYNWWIRENAEIDKAAVKEHNRRMHRIFLRHYAAARKTRQYGSAPISKKLLWMIYSCSPALSNYLVRTYHEGFKPYGR